MAKAPLPAPITAQGTRLSFRGTPLGRVVGVDGSRSCPPRVIRPLDDAAMDGSGRYVATLEPGQVEEEFTVQAIAPTLDESEVGQTGELDIEGKGWGWTGVTAYLESAKVSGKAGDFVRVSFTFRRSGR